MDRWPPPYIAVEGPIGVGKTTLARRLGETFNTHLLLENAGDNPFLPRFYRDPKSAALPTQLHFLFQRTRQIQELRQGDFFRPSHVADFLIQKDKLFASVTLDPEELSLYYQVYNRLGFEAPTPDLVIYLQAPVDVLMHRIFTRGLEYERYMDEQYLQRIANAYIEFFYHYHDSPLLIVNTSDFNLADDNDDYVLLLERMRGISHGRHYFNPQQL